MKKRVFEIVGSILIFCFFGFLGTIGFALAMLMGWPLYLTYSLAAVGAAVLVVGCLCATGALRGRGCRWGWRAVALVALCAVIYCGHGYWKDSLPTVDDRSLLLWEYVPFEPENKLVSLEGPAALQFDSPHTLKLDGATALYPIYAAFVQAVYPAAWESTGVEIDYLPYDGPVQCSGTIEAYERLIRGETDIIFAAGPSEAQMEAAQKADKEFHLTPIGREAFVFFVNSRNPVTDLTVDQIRGIYAGEITNWKEVGGKRQSIRPFQRAENSGSQTALQNLMAGKALMEPEEEDRIGGMGGIITEVASYRNYKNALGFSFRYYATEMVQNGDIRLLALNGVEPTRETIRDGSYPIASEFYAVTCSPIGEEPPEANNQVMADFLDWVLSDQGQAIIEKTGYVSLH